MERRYKYQDMVGQGFLTEAHLHEICEWSVNRPFDIKGTKCHLKKLFFFANKFTLTFLLIFRIRLKLLSSTSSRWDVTLRIGRMISMGQKNIWGNKIAKIVITSAAILLSAFVLAISTEQYINDVLRPITECPPGEIMVPDTVNGGYDCVPSGSGGVDNPNIPHGEFAEEALPNQLERPIGQESESKQRK